MIYLVLAASESDVRKGPKYPQTRDIRLPCMYIHVYKLIKVYTKGNRERERESFYKHREIRVYVCVCVNIQHIYV